MACHLLIFPPLPLLAVLRHAWLGQRYCTYGDALGVRVGRERSNRGRELALSAQRGRQAGRMLVLGWGYASAQGGLDGRQQGRVRRLHM